MKIRRTIGAIAVLLALSGAARAGEGKDPFGYSVMTYIWVLVLAAFGGAVNFSRKMREGATRAFNLTEFIGELVTSGFAGLLTFWLCEAADISKMMTAVLVGISGHMGSRAIFRMEKWAEEKFGSRP